MTQILEDTQARSWAKTGLLKEGIGKNARFLPRRTFSETLGRGAGSMLLERRETGVIEVYLVLRRGGRQERRKLGKFEEVDEHGQRCGLFHWRKEAQLVSAAVRQFDTLDAYDEHLRRIAAEREKVAAEEARQGTFGQLLSDYVDNMERLGRASAKEVRGSLKLNVLGPFPGLCARRAKEITPVDIHDIVRHCLQRPVATKGRGTRLTKASATNGKKRQADKVRAYLQAAFSFGLGNDLDPLRVGNTLYGLTVNPARDVPVIKGAKRANTWALTKDELREVVLAIEELSERHRAIAKSMLYLAGQRVEMLCRVVWADFIHDSEHGRVMRLVDRKGGHDTPDRDHLLPITPRLAQIMKPLLALEAQGKAPGPFSIRGSVNISPSTALNIFADLGDRLASEGKARRFTWRNIRVTIETHLAAMGISQERRAWLLSHGRSGVQAKHYDRYSYLREKRQDLGRWEHYLDGLAGEPNSGNVLPLHG